MRTLIAVLASLAAITTPAAAAEMPSAADDALLEATVATGLSVVPLSAHAYSNRRRCTQTARAWRCPILLRVFATPNSPQTWWLRDVTVTASGDWSYTSAPRWAGLRNPWRPPGNPRRLDSR